MEKYIEEYCKHLNIPSDKIIQRYNNLNKVTIKYFVINYIIDYKIENNKNIIYKEDILKIFLKIYKKDLSQEEFMKNVIIDIKKYNLDINNLTIRNCFRNPYLWLYYLSTFLDYEPVDIKIALKD